MTLAKLMGWLRDNPEPARELMRQNRSYIFFRDAAELDDAQGPIGGAGIPLDAGPFSRGRPHPVALWPADLGRRHAAARARPHGAAAASDGGAGYRLRHRRTGAGRFLRRQRRGRRNPAGLMRHAVTFVILQPKTVPMSRRRRSLTGEERKLWAHVARDVVPMKGRALPLEPETAENAAGESRSRNPFRALPRSRSPPPSRASSRWRRWSARP